MGKRLALIATSVWLAACAAQVATETARPVASVAPTGTPMPSATAEVIRTSTPIRVPVTETLAPTATVVMYLKPEGGWNVPVWQLLIPTRAIGWHSNNELEFGSLGDKGHVVLDIGTGRNMTPTPWPDPLTRAVRDRIYSPDENYYALCLDDRVELHRASDDALVGQKDAQVVCYFEPDWANDSKQLAFSDFSEQRAYVWDVAETTPRLLAISIPVLALEWSPDSKRFLITSYSPSNSGDEAALYVVSSDGKSVSLPVIVSAGNQWEPWYPNWLTSSTFCNSRSGAGRSSADCYDAASGRRVFGWSIDYTDSQGESVAPNGHWMVIDAGLILDDTAPRYALIDSLGQQRFAIPSAPQQTMQFLGWPSNSSSFYLVSRPLTETAQANPEAPFGLLALDPQSRTFTQLFKQAVFAELSPDQKFAWVVFPAKHEDGSLGLDGGLFDMATATLTARQFVADTMLYGNPADGDLVPTAWDHAGKQLVFSASDGGLTVVKTNGEAQTLTTDLPITGDVWPYNVRLEWSPDDAHLLVQYGERAWVVTVP